MTATDESSCPEVRILLDDGGGDGLRFRQALVSVGSGAGNDVIVTGGEAADRHVEICFRQRGWQLHVLPGAERVHVNARPVQRLALLRLGDRVTVAGHKLALLPVDDDVPPPEPEAALAADAPAALMCGLRAVAGPLSGRCLALRPGLQLDHLLLPGMVGCVRLHGASRSANFEVVGDDATRPSCNGVEAPRGALHQGDQLAWGRHRFVLETLASPPRLAPAPEEQEPEPAGRANRSLHREMLWLLGMAVLLAGLIAVLLLLRS